jgi:uncharacterized protein
MNHKRQLLTETIEEYTREDICVAFSGGIDSSLILRLASEGAKRQGTKVYAVTFDTVLHPRCDVEIAKRVAGEMGVIHHVIAVNELDNPQILENPRNRCYLCKKTLFCELLEYARKMGVSTILEGTNYDDLSQYRPGLQAIRELGIESPLAKTELTKEEIRTWADELGISVARRPSTPCLATRLPYGTKIRPEVLKMIDEGESYLRGRGYANVRIRMHGKIGRIEIDKEEFSRFLEEAGEAAEYLKQLGISYVTLDLEGFRSGSMDE